MRCSPAFAALLVLLFGVAAKSLADEPANAVATKIVFEAVEGTNLAEILQQRRRTLEERSGAGGLTSVVWGALGHLASLAGRDDLADRCEAGYRRTLERPRAGSLAWTELLVYRKGLR